LKSDDEIFLLIRKRVHGKLESLIEEIKGNWWDRTVRVSWRKIMKYEFICFYCQIKHLIALDILNSKWARRKDMSLFDREIHCLILLLHEPFCHYFKMVYWDIQVIDILLSQSPFRMKDYSVHQKSNWSKKIQVY
jgi:hypothetical protein